MERKLAFTLIELLIVIAIVSVLAALLFPVFAAAKSAAKKTTAINNLGQVGRASFMYLSDYDEHLPFRYGIQPSWPGYNVIIRIIGDSGWSKRFDAYLKSKDVWFSPGDRLTNRGYTSFAFNDQLSYDWQYSQIARPAEAIYATDRTDVAAPDAGPPFDAYSWWQFTDQHPFRESSLPGVLDPVSVASQIDPIRYENSVAAYLFLDGHVAAMPFDKTWGDASHNLHLVTKS